MALSSNTLIHFTKEKEALKGILGDNFRVSYCTETPALGEKNPKLLVPMVSFCDIPLSEVKDHIAKYGCYGIGLTREWAARNGLNPVLYLEQNSKVAESYNVAAQYLADQVRMSQKKKSLGPEQIKATVALANLLAFVKNYEGPLARKGETGDRYRFSDEREWRYVPIDHGLSIASASHKDSPEAWEKLQAPASKLRLHFEPNDIKYIIIKDDSEIREFVDHLRTVKGKYAYHDVERLTTRILTADQIHEDF